MRAVVVKSFKSAPEIAEIPVPQPRQDEVLVRLSAAGVNPFDWKIADGMLDGQVGHTFPFVLGLDGAGTVEAVGRETRRFAVGDRVFGQFWQIPLGRGTYTQYCAISESAPLARKPEPLSMADAAALPTAGMAALDLLEKSGLTMGDTILIVGATGGVGQFLTQLARQRALYVIATGTTADVEMLKALGAHSVVDLTGGSLNAQLRGQVPEGIDGLLDLASAPAEFTTFAALVRKGGVALTTNFVADKNALALSGIRGGNFTLGANSSLVERLGAAAGTGKVKIPIERRVPFDQALTAIEGSRNGHARGKTVILI
jgi:NADPH:quinone reductase-like Zn-dependent oxidoreductase